MPAADAGDPDIALVGNAAFSVGLPGTIAWLLAKAAGFAPPNGLVFQPAHPLIATADATVSKLAMIVGNLLKVVTHFVEAEQLAHGDSRLTAAAGRDIHVHNGRHTISVGTLPTNS